MVLWMIFLLVLIIGIGVLFLRTGRFGTRFSDETPLDILKKRYVHGDITTEEYECMKRTLEH